MMMSRNWNGSRRLNAVKVNVGNEGEAPAAANLIRLERFLVSVNVVGSTGALRFIVNKNDAVSSVIDAALKSYAREGRVPALGSDPDHFLLYSAAAPSQALSPEEKIGRSCDGGRKFVMCKKKQEIKGTSTPTPTPSWNWKAWLKKTLLT